MEFTKGLLKQVQTDIDSALASIAKKHGIDIRCGGGSFGPLEATLRLKLTAVGEGGETAMERDYKLHAVSFGLKEEWLGKTFVFRGRTVKIAGLLPKRVKYPIAGVYQDTGKMMLFMVETVSGLLQVSPTSVGNGELTAEDKKEFEELAGGLSPENLSCDGEASRSQISSRRAALNRRWAALEAKVGRRVPETEVWDWIIEATKGPFQSRATN